MRALIPFKLSNPKSRLSSLLSLEERRELAYNMLLDVVEVVGRFVDEMLVLVPPDTEAIVDFAELKGVCAKGLEIVEDERDLDTAVNTRLERDTAVIMSDLPLLTEEVLERFFQTEGDVVIAPGRRGGTNMLLVRVEGFRVSYHYGSFFKHLTIARRMGLRVRIFDSFYASLDIDEEDDLLELLMHGERKRSRRYLKSIGFEVDLSEEQPKLIRAFREPS